MASLRASLAYAPVELGFGTSGLRALVTDMTDLECYINSLGFLEFLAGRELIRPNATVEIAGDLRESTPRIMQAVMAAVSDAKYMAEYLGLIPTPALALQAITRQNAGIMVTGSHIPADRNGIKFYKPGGEVLKEDEVEIKLAVARARERIYGMDATDSRFLADGSLKLAAALPAAVATARDAYLFRYEAFFGSQCLAGHSAVGRDDLVELLQRLGAVVKPVGRSNVFVPIDSENITAEHQAYFKKTVTANLGTFAMVSTDGDSDRPFVIDEHGDFHRGDVLGAVVAHWLDADAASFPVSSSDAVTMWLDQMKVGWVETKIGSPYVVSAMAAAVRGGKKTVVGWEVNGGFMTGSEVVRGEHKLQALPTRDAIFPIIVALVAAKEEGIRVSQLFARLPKRYTQAGLIDNFPVDASRAILQADLSSFFSPDAGFSAIRDINRLDGMRLYFENGDIAHLRPSGNAPQMRVYSVADSQARADEIVKITLAEPDGILREMERVLTAKS
jgi:phosphomannomutase